jgi:hypothetical protein
LVSRLKTQNPKLHHKDTSHYFETNFFIRKSVSEMKRIVLFAILFGSFLHTATAQLTSVKEQPTNIYTIQLGAFDPSVKQADFEAIRAYAYVYLRDGLVFAGNFADENAAEPTLEKIKAKGFTDAFIAARSLKKAKNVYVIQIATRNAGESMNWKAYANIGDLYTIPNLAQVRIVHGYYDEKGEANMKLKEIQEMGFADAFVKSVKDVQINPLSVFDTGDKKLIIKSPTDETAGSKNPLIEYGSRPTTVVATPTQTKRKSVIKLQEALNEGGAPVGAVDGLFGKATQLTFERAIQNNRRLQTFSELSQKHAGFDGWADARLLMTISRELSVKDNATAIVPDLLNNLPDEALTAAETTGALNWHVAHWKKLDAWSALSQYNDQVATAYKIAYYRSLVHLEDYFAAKGLRGEAATALSVSVIKTLVGKDFDGF